MRWWRGSRVEGGGVRTDGGAAGALVRVPWSCRSGVAGAQGGTRAVGAPRRPRQPPRSRAESWLLPSSLAFVGPGLHHAARARCSSGNAGLTFRASLNGGCWGSSRGRKGDLRGAAETPGGLQRGGGHLLVSAARNRVAALGLSPPLRPLCF